MSTANDLAALLRRSARGDRHAFRRFYDATASHAHALELARTARAGRNAGDAERATTGRFLLAWEHAGEHAASGLTPLAWLLSLPVPAVAAEPVRAIA